MTTLIAITTYRKNLAVDQLLETLIRFNYHQGNTILIADDNNGEALPVYEKYKNDISLAFVYGPNLGVAVNKNRAIKYFLEHPEYENILHLDDDLLFIKEGIIDHCKKVCSYDLKLPFVGGYWTDKQANVLNSFQVSGKTWQQDFPIVAETSWCTFHKGCQGVLMYVEREVAERVGYMNVLPLKYGFEHSLYFSRLLRTVGYAPELFPVLKYCEEWYHGNDIPNNYEYAQTTEEWEAYIKKVFEVNSKAYQELMGQIYQGYRLKNGNPGLSRYEQCIIPI